jgi:hypothetical protein
MHIKVSRFAASTADPDYDGMAHMHVVSENGYRFSLSRDIGSSLVEVMVCDQLNCMVSDVNASLSQSTLHVELPVSVAAQLDGHASYEIEFRASSAELECLHKVLSTIFNEAGFYERKV